MPAKPAATTPATDAPVAKAAAQPMTTREVADKIGTDPKTLRRFLRTPQSTFPAAGQGGRYSFVQKDMGLLKKKFTAWQKAEVAAREARAAAKVKKEAKAEAAPVKGSGKGEAPQAPTFTSRELAEQRVDRLETMLKARGTHISQHAV